MISIKTTQRRIHIDTEQIQKQLYAMLAALNYESFDLGVWFTTNTTIRSYNKIYRQQDKVTDILSFPYHPELIPGDRIVIHEPEDKNLGDLILSPAYIARTHHKWNRTFDKHLTILLVHGVAHLLGYDHETNEEYAQMQIIEKQLLEAAQD